MTPDSVATLLGTWGYPAYVLLFMATAFGSPITEDLLLLTGGFLVSAQIFSWSTLLPLSYVCVLASDSVLYGFGRVIRTNSLKRSGWLRRLIRPAQLRVATRWFGRFGDRVVCIARFVPGTRLLVFITAGVRGLPYWRFLVLDGLATLVYVPVVLMIGASFGRHIGDLHRAIAWVNERAYWVIGVVIALLIVRHAWRRMVRRWMERAIGP